MEGISLNLLIKNGSLLSDNNEIIIKDIYIENGVIKSICNSISVEDVETYDAKGLFIAPGFIDVHVHLREPGYEYKETFETGTRAAAAGGFTQIAAMPNTNPVPDRKEVIEKFRNMYNNNKVFIKTHYYSSISKKQLGNELVNFKEMAQAGAFAFSDDGVGVQSAGTMFQAMKHAAEVNKVIVAHCEDRSLLNGGVFNEGETSQQLNVKGINSVSESVQVARDVLLAEAAKCQYHVCHISTSESVRTVRDAKAAGIKVTCEVTPHHLLLCDKHITSLDSNFKMNPPLRSEEDMRALINGVVDGTIDCIATDHAPHSEEEKSEGIEKAPFGIIGLETAFPLLYTNLVLKNIISLNRLVELLSKNPAKIFNLNGGEISEGKPADLVIIDLKMSMKINKNEFLSKGRNTPFDKWECIGWPVATFVEGKLVWER
jgi:dihydroorotase